MASSLHFRAGQVFFALLWFCRTVDAQNIAPVYLNPPDQNPYGSGFSSGVNSHGQVAGYYQKSGEQSYTLFAWQNGNILVTQPLDNFGSTGAINDVGQVVIGDNGGVPPQIWQNGIYKALPTVTHLAVATGINNQGEVPGCEVAIASQIDFFYIPASVVWKNYRLTRVGLQGDAIRSCANGINNSGQVVGYTRTGPFSTGYLADNGTVTNIVAGNVTSAYAINDSGQVVGSFYNAVAAGSGPQKAFLWQNGASQELTPPGTTQNAAISIDSQGRVLISSNANSDGWVWKNGTFFHLDQVYRVSSISSVGSGAIVAGACRNVLPEGGTLAVPCIWNVP
ncbi:MAG: hypothetical protein ACKV2U_11400 [Bryobacteraceae bacterium]